MPGKTAAEFERGAGGRQRCRHFPRWRKLQSWVDVSEFQFFVNLQRKLQKTAPACGLNRIPERSELYRPASPRQRGQDTRIMAARIRSDDWAMHHRRDDWAMRSRSEG